MKRAAMDRPRAIRIWRKRSSLSTRLGHFDREYYPGHFRKGLRVGGCGNSACWLCHGGKIEGRPTIQEWRHDLSYRDQLSEAAIGLT